MTARLLDLPDHLTGCGPMVWRAIMTTLEQRCCVLALDSFDRDVIELHPAESRTAAIEHLLALPAVPTRVAVLAWPARLHRPDGPPVLSVHIEAAHGPACGFVFDLERNEPFADWLCTAPERLTPEVPAS